MSLKKTFKRRHTLVFQLTLWYVVFFAVSSLAAFSIFYLLVNSLSRSYADADLLTEYNEFQDLMRSSDMQTVKSEILLEAQAEGVDKFFIMLFRPSGQILAYTDLSSWQNLQIDWDMVKKISDKELFQTVKIAGHPGSTRVIYGKVGEDIVMIGSSGRVNELFLANVRKALVIILLIFTSFAGFTGLFLAGRAVAGINEVSRAAREISGNALTRRVIVKGGGLEITNLASTFNNMLDRINLLINGMREMTDNIAHDLKSPITRIRGMAEMALTGQDADSNQQCQAADIIEECDRILDMINTMLLISEAESGAMILNRESVDIAEIVRDGCDLFMPIAEEKNINLTCSAAGNCLVEGDRSLLQRLTANLLDNALKYSAENGKVEISIRQTKKQVKIIFCDTGPGIAEDDIKEIFNRFYRADRSRTKPGSGLGLSLALAIAKAHGGTITTANNPGRGATFIVTLAGNRKQDDQGVNHDQT